MDFFIKSSYTAAQETSDSSTVAFFDAFFDDHRVMIMSLSLLLSFIVFGWQIFKHFQDKKDDKRSYGLSIQEGYWHKSVVLPLFVDKFVSSITEWTDDINSPNKSVDRINEIRNKFKKDKRELSSRTKLLCTVEDQVKENIRKHLDEIEDSIIRYLSDIQLSPDDQTTLPNQKIFENAEAIFKELMQDHQRFNK